MRWYLERYPLCRNFLALPTISVSFGTTENRIEGLLRNDDGEERPSQIGYLKVEYFCAVRLTELTRPILGPCRVSKTNLNL